MYLDAANRQRAALRGAEMEVSIDASLPRLEKNARLSALRNISDTGQVTYKVLASCGDRTVRQEVIARYLAAESDARNRSGMEMSLANYRFRLRAARSSGTRVIYIFQLAPRKKRVGLFRGELWVDGETGMPIRESGQFVKSPSVFIKRIRFAREYEIHGGVAMPARVESTVETRVVGRAELHVEYRNFRLAAERGGEPPGDYITVDGITVAGISSFNGITAVAS